MQYKIGSNKMWENNGDPFGFYDSFLTNFRKLHTGNQKSLLDQVYKSWSYRFGNTLLSFGQYVTFQCQCWMSVGFPA